MSINPRWIVAIVMIFVLGSVISNTMEMVSPLGGSTTVGNVSAVTTVLYRTTSFSRIEITDALGTASQFISAAGDTLGGIWDMLWWRYSFLETDNFFVNIAKYSLLWPLSIAFMFSLAYILKNLFSPSP